MISNYSRNIRIIIISLAVIVASSIVYTSCGTQGRAQSGTCPCNYDLEFWTRDQWVLTDNGLFDSCRSVSDITEIIGAETVLNEMGNGFQCGAVLSAQIRTFPRGECRAVISCIAIGSPGILSNYLQIENITPEEFQQCSNDILAVAAALPTNPCD